MADFYGSGVRVAIGTDSLASGDTLSPIHEAGRALQSHWKLLPQGGVTSFGSKLTETTKESLAEGLIFPPEQFTGKKAERVGVAGTRAS